MDTETMIRELKNVEEKHKCDKVFTGQLDIVAMAHDVRERLEELKPYEDTDQTAGEAIKAADTQPKYVIFLIKIYKDLAHLVGCEIVGRVAIKDKDTGRIWR